jgi:hypothetical protein
MGADSGGVQVNDRGSFGRWAGAGVPLLIGIGAAAAEILHVGFNLPLRQAFGVASVFVMIQIAMYVPMFWIRRRFMRTRDPRLAIALFGSYCLLMGLAAFHYGTELKLIGVQKSEYVTFSIVVIAAILLLVAVSPRWPANE